jgi:dTDP-4-dehydrorhamnose 3,5-epimerase
MDKIGIEGVLLNKMSIMDHQDGNIFHLMRNFDEGFCGFGEAYISTIKKNSIKGWKKHNLMTCNFLVPIGSIKIVLYDNRPNSITKGETQEFTLSNKNYQRLTIPSGIWYGFKGIDENDNYLVNISNMTHQKTEQENCNLDEFEIKYNW